MRFCRGCAAGCAHTRVSGGAPGRASPRRSFAAAQGEALAACLPAPRPAPWEKPNNILALCYLRALRRLGKPAHSPAGQA